MATKLNLPATNGADCGPGTTADDAPSVSVVIICYNHGAFLSDAIESVLSQTMRDFEVVVVDDGSTDDTPQVAAKFPGIRYFRQVNQGMTAAPRPSSTSPMRQRSGGPSK